MSDRGRILWFDAVRGSSALLVCAGHLRAALFCDYGEVLSPALWHQPFYFITSLGHQAVMVFFVLSGFFVGGAVIRSRQGFSWGRYLAARLSRLWTVLIPALLFTVIIDSFVSWAAPEVLLGRYSDIWSSGPQQGFYSATIATFLANVFFLQTIAAPVFGTNSPLWSLSNEFWYYVGFPPLVSALGARPDVKRVFGACLVLGIACWLPAGFLLGGFIWTLGALVYCALSSAPEASRYDLPRAVVSGMLFTFALILSKMSIIQAGMPLLADCAVGVAFAILAFYVAKVPAPFSRRLAGAVLWLSEISYTLYLFHFPLVVLIGGGLCGRQFQPGLLGMSVYACSLFVIVGVSHLAWMIFERNTNRVRRLLDGWCSVEPMAT